MPLSCLKGLILWIGCGVNSVLRMRFLHLQGILERLHLNSFDEARGRILKLQV